ncbi:MAG: hypothetical protein G3M78_04515 [Candidatus Nitrohelix vancouverensis]|uniref:Uncharacterized protein n=1 Tax=Candidatus Nitrohelix vancouverensis TaxID=2705534 RepID=A0A7T0C199_9BACT|nr:MAG: hypothetical protein G3M78_04515 [Candidatus Nitrohelix vancouverensis]
MTVSLSLATGVNAEEPIMTRNISPFQQIVLEPGWRTSCESNSVIANLGERAAKVSIRMGKDALIRDTIEDKRGYDLISALSFAKQLGRSVDLNDVALIENHSADARVRIHC